MTSNFPIPNWLPLPSYCYEICWECPQTSTLPLPHAVPLESSSTLLPPSWPLPFCTCSRQHSALCCCVPHSQLAPGCSTYVSQLGKQNHCLLQISSYPLFLLLLPPSLQFPNLTITLSSLIPHIINNELFCSTVAYKELYSSIWRAFTWQLLNHWGSHYYFLKALLKLNWRKYQIITKIKIINIFTTPKSFLVSLGNIFLTNPPNFPFSPGKQALICFLPLHISVYFLEFYINGVTHFILFFDLVFYSA